MQSISHVSEAQNKDGYHAVGVSDNGIKDTVPILESRAAAVPPTGTEPGYYLILGQKLEQLSNGKRPLLFLAERTCDNQGKLLRALGDDARRLNVRTIYAVEGTGFYTALWELFKGAQGIQIAPAPFSEDADYGLAMIKEWLLDKALDIPDARYQETEIRRHLEKATDKNASFVVDALRFFDRWIHAVGATVGSEPPNCAAAILFWVIGIGVVVQRPRDTFY